MLWNLFSLFLLAYSSFAFRHLSVNKHLTGAPFGQVAYSLVFKEVFKIIEKKKPSGPNSVEGSKLLKPMATVVMKFQELRNREAFDLMELH